MPRRAGPDEELLERLAGALEPANSPVPDTAMASLHAALDARNLDALEALTARRRPHRWRQAIEARWRRVAVAAALAGGVVVGGTGVAFAAGGNVPESVRAVVYHLGIPVDPPAVSEAHHDVSRLRAALRSTVAANMAPTGPAPASTAPTTLGGDRSSDRSSSVAGSRSVEQTVAAAQTLARQLTRLTPAQQRALGRTPWQLLAEAQRVEEADGLAVTPLPPSTWTGGAADRRSSAAADLRAAPVTQDRPDSTATTVSDAGRRLASTAGAGGGYRSSSYRRGGYPSPTNGHDRAPSTATWSPTAWRQEPPRSLPSTTTTDHRDADATTTSSTSSTTTSSTTTSSTTTTTTVPDGRQGQLSGGDGSGSTDVGPYRR